AAATRPGHPDLRAERAAQVLLDSLQLGIGRACARSNRVSAGGTKPPNELLRLPNGEVILDHGADDPRLGVWFEPAKRPRVALRETSIDDRRLHGRMEVEQPERVRDGRS